MTEQTAVRKAVVPSTLQGIIVERQRRLIREANCLRGLVGLPPVRAEKDRDFGPTTTGVPDTVDGSGQDRARQ
jgi:hypothetical protein